MCKGRVKELNQYTSSIFTEHIRRQPVPDQIYCEKSLSIASLIKTAIVCSNNPGLRSELALQLKKLGIICYRSTATARACYEEILEQHERCDLLITDSKLDDLLASELIAKLRSREKLLSIHVIVLATEGEIDLIEGCLERGISGFVFKPVTEANFNQEISDIFTKHRHYITDSKSVHELAAARFFRVTKNYRKAVDHYERVLQSGKNAEILFELGQIYATLRNKAPAVQCFREAMDLDPSFRLDIAEFIKRNPLEDEKSDRNQISDKAISLFERPVELPVKQFYGKERIASAVVGARSFSIRSPVRGMLRDVGIKQVSSESTGDELYRILRSKTIDLVVIEMNLDDVNALQLIELIRKDVQFNKVKILILVQSTELANVRLAFELGADGICQKPYSTQNLQYAIHMMMLLEDMTVRSGERRSFLKAAYGCYKVGLYQDAYSVIKSISKHHHEDSFACLLWAMLLHRLGHENQAESYYQLATHLNSQFSDLAFRLREHVESANEAQESSGRASILLDDIKFGALEFEASLAEAELDAAELQLVNAGRADIKATSSESMSNVIRMLDEDLDLTVDFAQLESIDLDAVATPREPFSRVETQPKRQDPSTAPISEQISRDLTLKGTERPLISTPITKFSVTSEPSFPLKGPPTTHHREKETPDELVFHDGEIISASSELPAAMSLDWIAPERLEAMKLPPNQPLVGESVQPDQDSLNSLLPYRRQILALCEQGTILVSRLQHLPEGETTPLPAQDFLWSTARSLSELQEHGHLAISSWRNRWDVKKLQAKMRRENDSRQTAIELGIQYLRLGTTATFFDRVLKFWKTLVPNVEGSIKLPENLDAIALTRAVLKLDRVILDLHRHMWDGFHSSRENLELLVTALKDGDDIKVQELNRILAKDHWSLSMFKEIYQNLTLTSQDQLRNEFFDSNADQYSRKRSVRDGLGDFLMSLGSFKHANFMLEISHRESGTNIAYLHKLAINSMRMERYKEAGEWASRMLKIDRANPEGYNILGVSSKKQGRTKDSIKHYLKGLRYAPESSKLAHNLAIAYASIGDLKNSALYHQRAKELGSKDDRGFGDSTSKGESAEKPPRGPDAA